MAVPSVSMAQKAKGIVKGKIYNTEGEVVPYVSIQEIRTNIIVQASSVGEFQIKLPSDTALILEFKALGYAVQRFPIKLKPKEVLELSPFLVSETKEFAVAEIKEDRNRDIISTITLNPKDAKVLPSPFGDFTAIFKTLPGVVSNNELSSAYSVRGGSFDENLVYVNDIEIYRPQLVGAGQQEGLSFVNTDLVKKVEFSSGGFQPRYGDKLSSVLNIEYKTPTKWAGNATASLLYQAFSVEGVSKNGKLSFVAGVRQKTAQYLFLGLDVKGQYFPRFFDAQTYITYDLTSEAQKKRDSKTTIGLLASYARNRYLLRPESQETEFGTLNSKLRFEVGYIGEETMYYDTWQNGLKLSHTFNNKLRSDFTFSQVYTREREYIDVEGGYRLCDVQSDPSKNNFNECIALRAIGTFYNYGRNSLKAQIYSMLNRNYWDIDANNRVEFGVTVSTESLTDRLYEYNFTDSADYVTEGPLLESSNRLSSERFQGYVQHVYAPTQRHTITYGARFNYWSLNKQFLVSPRIQFAYRADSLRRTTYRLAAGVYQQQAFYREMRDRQGNLNRNIRAQRSIHLISGADIAIKIWDRSFKLTCECYYKQIENVIAYDVENVRIRYFANNLAKAWAWGTEFRFSGEFIKGAESWFSLGVLSTKEDLLDDTRGYYRRPTDQRLTFSTFFQDNLPGNPSVRAYLNMIVGTGLPFSPPNNRNARSAFTAPPYRRLDIGVNKVIKLNDQETWFDRTFDQIWLGVEVLNVLGVSNTISYQWIADLNSNQYAIPNTLSARFLNVKLVASFE
jgi:hypothetical protein